MTDTEFNEAERRRADDIIRVSNLGTVDVTPDHKGSIVGFLARCRTLLGGLTKMFDADIDDVGDALVRSIYEHTAAALWLADDPATNYDRLREGYVNDWKKIRDHHRQLHPDRPFIPEADVDELLAEVPNPRPLPSIQQRAGVSGLDQYYVTYRIFCASVHGTFHAAALGLDRKPEINLRATRFSLAGRMVLLLTEATRRALGLDEDPEIARLTEELMAPALAVARRSPQMTLGSWGQTASAAETQEAETPRPNKLAGGGSARDGIRLGSVPG
jgi:hypothetical protein